MVDITIVCLIYKSSALAKAVYESAKKHTPKLATGEAEFIFIANDPTEELVKYLKKEKVPHYINLNDHLSEDELFERGIGAPEYMRRVYQGYNAGIMRAQGQKIVLINSDNFFSDDWLENLLKYSDYKKVVSSTLVEPGQGSIGVFPFAIEKNFGKTLDDFEQETFLDFANRNKKTGFTSGGAYMPCLLYRDVAVMAGLYPEGNIAGDTFEEVARFGDEQFYDNLRKFGVEHITAKDSIVYHLKEGEKSEASADESKLYQSAQKNDAPQLDSELHIHPVDLVPYIYPDVSHMEILSQLARKYTAVLVDPQDDEEIDRAFAIVEGLNERNIELVILTENKKIAKKYQGRASVPVVEKLDKGLYDLFHRMYGEFLLPLDVNSDKYRASLFDEVQDRNAVYFLGDKPGEVDSAVGKIGNFVIPKRVLLDNIPTFLGYVMAKDEVVVDPAQLNGDFALMNISEVEADTPRRPAVRRLVGSIRHEGVIPTAKKIARRLTR